MKIQSLLWYPFAFYDGGYYLLVLNQVHTRSEWTKKKNNFIDSVSKLVSISLDKNRLSARTQASGRIPSSSLTSAETIFDNTHLMIAYLDSQFNFIRVNCAYASADGHEPSFYIGKNHFELFPHQENKEIFQRVVDSGKRILICETV